MPPPKRVQFNRLRKRPDGLYDSHALRGRWLRGFRGTEEAEGAELPAFGDDFIVAKLTLAVGDIVEWRGQYRKVTGIVRAEGVKRIERAETELALGSYPVYVPDVPGAALRWRGNVLEWLGETLEWTPDAPRPDNRLQWLGETLEWEGQVLSWQN